MQHYHYFIQQELSTECKWAFKRFWKEDRFTDWTTVIDNLFQLDGAFMLKVEATAFVAALRWTKATPFRRVQETAVEMPRSSPGQPTCLCNDLYTKTMSAYVIQLHISTVSAFSVFSRSLYTSSSSPFKRFVYHPWRDMDAKLASSIAVLVPRNTKKLAKIVAGILLKWVPYHPGYSVSLCGYRLTLALISIASGSHNTQVFHAHSALDHGPFYIIRMLWLTSFGAQNNTFVYGERHVVVIRPGCNGVNFSLYILRGPHCHVSNEFYVIGEGDWR